MKKDELNQFLIDGVKNYGMACKAVAFFRSELAKALEEILCTRDNWGCFTPVRQGKYIDSEPTNDYIEADIKGTYCSEEVFISIGAWWHSEFDLAEDVAFYACCYKLEPFDYTPQKSQVHIQRKGDCSYLYLIPSEELNLQHDFGLLLDELVNMLNLTKPQLRNKK